MFKNSKHYFEKQVDTVMVHGIELNFLRMLVLWWPNFENPQVKGVSKRGRKEPPMHMSPEEKKSVGAPYRPKGESLSFVALVEPYNETA